MIEGRKEKPLRREEGEKERSVKFSFWGKILAWLYLLFEKIRKRRLFEETTENSTNESKAGETEGVTRRWVLVRLLPLALALAGCLSPEERQTRFNYPILEQEPPPPLSKEIRSVQDFVDTYAEDFLKPYVHDDQILLHLNNKNRVDRVTYISDVLS